MYYVSTLYTVYCIIIMLVDCHVLLIVFLCLVNTPFFYRLYIWGYLASKEFYLGL